MALTVHPSDHRRRVLATLASLLVVLTALGRGGGPGAGTAEPTTCFVGEPASLTELEHCLTLRPDDVRLLVEVGDSYAAAGRAREAVALFERAVRADPRDADALVRLSAAVIANDPAAAHALASRALALRPNSAHVLDLLARSEAQSDR
jgi:predicted Zn-dependent protease